MIRNWPWVALALLMPVTAFAATESAAARAADAHSTPDPAVLEEARKLLADNKADAAYQLLAPHESEWAGDKDFDYLMGAAAVDSRRPDEAILSLQRVIASDPAYAAARMELARAYYEVGDNESARQEFEELLRENPPDYARRTINSYLLAIKGREAPKSRGPRLHYFVQGSLGYDNNANGSTSDNTFLGFTLNDQNVAKESGFAGVSYGASYVQQVVPRVTNQLSGQIDHRRNFSASFVNYDRAVINDAFNWHNGDVDLDAGVGIFATLLDSNFPFDGDYNQSGATLDLGAHRQFGKNWRFGGDLHFIALRYARAIRVRNVNETIGDLTAEYYTGGKHELALSAAAIFGNDDAIRTGSPYGRGLAGGRLAVSWLAIPKVRVFTYAGVLRSDYDGLFFGSDREDRQTTAGISAVCRLFQDQGLALIPELAYTDNESDVSLFDYDRTVASVSLRWSIQ
jgi:FimV-like protein